MWNLVEPELFRMEPLCGTSRNLAEPGARFRAAAPNHPGALLEEPQAFQAVGEKSKYRSFFGGDLTCSGDEVKRKPGYLATWYQSLLQPPHNPRSPQFRELFGVLGITFPEAQTQTDGTSSANMYMHIYAIKPHPWP